MDGIQDNRKNCNQSVKFSKSRTTEVEKSNEPDASQWLVVMFWFWTRLKPHKKHSIVGLEANVLLFFLCARLGGETDLLEKLHPYSLSSATNQ